MRLYGLLGSKYISMGQTRGVWGHAIPGNFIRHNLVKSGTVFTQTYFHNLPFIVLLKLL